MISDYITFAAARATQCEALGQAIVGLTAAVTERQGAGELTGPGPIFVGIGASLAASSAPVWALRSRGVHSWRLGAGDLPVPFPATDHPIIGVSQSGRSAETLAVLQTVDPALRYAVVNNRPSPIADLVGPRAVTIGNIPDSYASTIGYTATVAALGLLADAWNGGRIGADWADLTTHFAAVEQAVGARKDELAATFAGVTTADFVGAGPAIGSAEAGALLFREVARLASTAMGTRQYLHGSMESAGQGVHVVLGDERELEVAGTLADAGHRVILITGAEVDETDRLQVVRLPRLAATPRAILEALVMQILVEAVARQAGIDIEEFVFHNSDTKIGSGTETEKVPASEAGAL